MFFDTFPFKEGENYILISTYDFFIGVVWNIEGVMVINFVILKNVNDMKKCVISREYN